MTEQEILDRYSTPGLRRNELTPSGKRYQLASVGIKGEDADKIIAQVYLPAGMETYDATMAREHGPDFNRDR